VELNAPKEEQKTEESLPV